MPNQLTNQELEEVLKNSSCLISEEKIASTYDKLAAMLNVHYNNLNPIIIVILNGGLIPAGHLLTRLSFFHRMDYLHATRYQNNQGTQDLVWKAKPNLSIENEHVLLIDDIFDEGITLHEITKELHHQNPASIRTCALLNKQHDRKPDNFKVDFIGLDVEDYYIYGCGMDYHGYFRHLSGIYALKEEV